MATAMIGITSFAADELGDIVYVELPEVGARLTQFGAFGVVESVKAVSDLFAPASGEVLEVNADLRASPELLNTDPFGAGWIAKVALGDPAELDRCSTRRRTRRSPPADVLLAAHRCRPRADARGDRGRVGGRPLRRHPRRRSRDALRPAGPARRAGGARRAVAAGGPQPDPAHQLPGRRGVSAPGAVGGERGDRPGGVQHRLHALPARGQPGHAAEHLRVPVAHLRADRDGGGHRLPLRRGHRDRGGGADGLPADPSQPGRGLERGRTPRSGGCWPPTWPVPGWRWWRCPPT